jgi:glutathione synthase/RimK-type ligase-like ATP-grasp enzyme
MVRSTILILGTDDDEHTCHVLTHLRNHGHDAELIDSRWFPARMTIAFDPTTGDGRLRLPSGRTIAFGQVRSVYWRAYHGIEVPQLPDPEQAWIAHNDARGLFESMLMQLPARWVNGWDAFRLHQTKPVQLARVVALGVRVPATILTNEPAVVKEFARRHSLAIVKPVQGGDHAAQLVPQHLSDLNLRNLELAPITVQQQVPGTNVRVFVAGEQVMACEIRTAAIDYREDPAPRLIVHDLPGEMQLISRRICRELHMLWTGIDFRLTPDGDYVFLEANPSPMFLGFEAQTGLRLIESLAALLLSEDSSTS